jgi:hypothetical protein
MRPGSNIERKGGPGVVLALRPLAAVQRWRDGVEVSGNGPGRLAILQAPATLGLLMLCQLRFAAELDTARLGIVSVGLATSAAPTYFRPLEHGGYALVDGGIWANNPIPLAVIEEMTCFDVGRDNIQGPLRRVKQ